MNRRQKARKIAEAPRQLNLLFQRKDRNFNATSVSVSPGTGSGQSKFCVDCFWIAPELQFAQGLKPHDWPPCAGIGTVGKIRPMTSSDSPCFRTYHATR